MIIEMNSEEADAKENLLALERLIDPNWRMNSNSTFNSSSWNREQDRAFECALAIYSDDSSDRWENIAAMVAGKTVDEIKHHYVTLLQDIEAIDTGSVPLPCYASSPSDSMNHAGNPGVGEIGNQLGKIESDYCNGRKSSKSYQERQRGIAWTEEEHRLFLGGLEKYGRGDWRSISRHFVVSRTPTQVASHAQKYFNRLNSANKERRRPSIHDITTVGGDATPIGPITGQMSGSPAMGSSSYWQPAPSVEPDSTMYVPPTIVQSIDSPSLISTFGTSLDLPSPAEMVYGVRPLTPKSFVSGTPMNMPPMTYRGPPSTDQK